MRDTRVRKIAPLTLAFLLGLYAMLAAGYFVLRYAGRWTDSDTTSLTAASAAIAEEGTLAPSRNVYNLGYAYQSVSVIVAQVTGLPLDSLQFWVFPLVAAGLALVAFALYRELTADCLAGALATLLLFLQPDFLFVLFRGSHEKVTWLGAMLALYALARSFRAAGRLGPFAVYVVLFYVASFCLIASNVFFGSSFILAVLVSLLVGLALLRVSGHWDARDPDQKTVVRLTYVLAAAAVLWFLSAFYVYPSAALMLEQLRGAADRSVAVGLGRVPAFDPYATLVSGWASSGAYLSLTLPSFIMAGLAFAAWLYMGIRYIRHKEHLLGDPPRFLLWLMFAGFGVQMAIGIALDQGGFIGGNLQHRLFPVAMLLAFPLIALAVSRLWQRSGRRLRARLLAAGLALLVVWSSAASLLKATNDPALSNYWTFWTLPEDRAARWVDNHLVDRSVWLGLDGIRVSAHAAVEGFGSETGNQTDAASPEPTTRHFLISDLDAQLGARQGQKLPDILGENRVYDNGPVHLYHLRPRTPYQK